MKRSIAYFEQAITADPEYALAHAGLADALLLQTWWGWNQRPAGYEKAKTLALRALELDGSLAEACATLGSILCYYDWKWEESRKMLKQAIQLNPNYATAHQYYAELLDILDENDAARAEINLAIELDPVFFMNQSLSCIYYIKEGRYNEAREANIRAQELNPDYLYTYLQFFTIDFNLGNDARAMEALQTFMAGNPITISYMNTVREVYQNSGMDGLWNLLAEIWQKDPSAPLSDIAWCYSILKDKERALTWMEKAINDRSSAIPRIMSYPEYDFLHQERRFRVLVEQMGLHPYFKKASG
jgi:tetratricopeptide (TPR) repeat protein